MLLVGQPLKIWRTHVLGILGRICAWLKPLKPSLFITFWNFLTSLCPAASGWLFWLLRMWWLITIPGASSLPAQSLPTPEIITSRQGLPQAFVPAIVQDRQGFIWMATRDGLARYDGNTFKSFQPLPGGKPSLSSSEVGNLAVNREGSIWITTGNGDVDLFDPAQETFVNVSRQPFYKRLIGTHMPNAIYVDSRNTVWLSVSGLGLYSLDWPKKQIRNFRKQQEKTGELNSDEIHAIIEDRIDKTKLWLATYAGLERLDRQTGHIIRYSHQPNVPTSLPDNVLKALYQLPSGHLLIRSRHYVSVFDPVSGQVQKSYPLPRQEDWWHWTPIVADQKGNLFIACSNSLFRFTEQEGLTLATQLPAGLACKSLFIDRSEVLWVGTNGGGVLKYNLRAGAFRAVPYQVSFYSDLLIRQLDLPATHIPVLLATSSYLFRSTTDKAGKLWLNVSPSSIFRFDVRTKKLTIIPLPDPMRAKADDFPVPMATDPQGRVWVIYDSLAAWYDEARSRWIRFPNQFRSRIVEGWPAPIILEAVVDEQAIWLATKAEGLFRVDRQTGAVRQYTHQSQDPTSLSNNSLYCLAADPIDKHILWIGTFGSGLCRFDKRTGRSRCLTTADGLPNNVIYSAIPDRYGALWIGTNQGLARMDRRTFKTRIYTHEDGLAGDEFNRHHYLQSPDGRIFLGGLEGITVFDPANLQADTYQPPTQITSIQINGRPLPPDAGSPITLSALTLPYDKNFVTVQFAGMQFNRRSKLKYRYQLEGLETNWTETDRPVAVYTDLQPGHYVLRLNAANTSGVWSRQVRTLRLTIEPPIWATWWAYVLYTLTVGGILYGLIRQYVNWFHLQQSVQLKQKEVDLKQQEAEQLRKTDEMKSRFFANITHEFRTPLTLILAPTEQMISANPDPGSHRRLLTIEQNANQLLQLINQLLDLSRLEANVMPIYESSGNLTDCVSHWLQPFIEQATTQGLTLTFTSALTKNYSFDAGKLERIVYNLVANALKFTRQGSIAVSLSSTVGGVQLRVTDTGIGIPTEHLPRIFDRFYQVGSGGSAAMPPSGTGIGLALVAELVQLQKGTISVDSRAGEGTTFVVELPYQIAGVAEHKSETIAATASIPASRDYPAVPATYPAEAPVVLLVEDNDELAHFIAESLSDSYRVSRAVNGRDGLEQALDQLPDLIISDVLMPEMDGYTLCGQLKTDQRTSHIPIILLTAKVTLENRLEGLTQGADEYLTKPFHVDELRLRVHNLLELRQRQRDWIRQQLTRVEVSNEEPPFQDPFLTRLYTLLDANLSNPQLNIDHLTDAMAMSRTHLHRKVKSLTGYSATELVRTYRLKAAAVLLRQGFNSAETGYRVGFENRSYFARCFREVYGMTPGEFVRTHSLS